MSLPELQQDIEDALALRESDWQATENKQLTMTGLILTIVFGLAAAPALADQIILPVWKLSSLSVPSNLELQKVFSVLLAIALIFLIVMTSLLLKPRSRRRSYRN